MLEESQRSEILPLYRYQPFPAQDEEKKNWIRQIFVEHKLFFPCRTLFNDPFDGVVPSLLEIPGTVLKRFVEEFVERQFPAESAAGKATKISKLMSVDALEGLQKTLQ